MKIRPVDERILIRALEEEERKVGGIIIPDTAKERPQMGEVVALGDDVEHTDRKQKKLSEIVKVGDRVIYARYGGTEVKMDGEEFLIVSRNDILAVVQK
ncbi:MAG: co-chaperone GroES [Calditrichaeota bacterium]|nr:co-chaperone GroES [Calditrichota bacterium]